MSVASYMMAGETEHFLGVQSMAALMVISVVYLPYSFPSSGPPRDQGPDLCVYPR